MREELLQKLTALDFAAVDLHLYLNTHPCDSKAIENYNCIIAEANAVRAHYEEAFGPLCGFRSESRDQNDWQWINEPWPWEQSFNFNLDEGAC